LHADAPFATRKTRQRITRVFREAHAGFVMAALEPPRDIADAG
jgi:hypothetical protein